MAQFVARYGWDAYFGTGRRLWNRCWPTTDGRIPWRLFFTMYLELRPLLASDRLTQSSAVIHGLAVAFGKKHESEAMILALEQEASPMIPRETEAKESDGDD